MNKTRKQYPNTPRANKGRNTGIKSANTKKPSRREGYVAQIIPKTLTRVRSDISTWKAALRQADNVSDPKRTRLAKLYDDVMQEAHLTSLVELRLQTLLGSPSVLKRGADVDEEATELIKNATWRRDLERFAWEEVLYGHSLVELTTDAAGGLSVTLLPRTNVIPERGVLLRSEDDGSGIRYREAREYRTWVLEFGGLHEYGLLNKAIPLVLFSRFALQCWSELCEIYAIPPRVLKTNTQDPEMLDRAEHMMRDFGAAAWFVIDTNEEFSFAKGADTNGDVYRNLIATCKEATSLLICGAQMGQDTINGNRSKEESSQKLFERIVMADRTRMAGYWNEVIIPALVRIGILPEGLRFEYEKEEDTEKLWQQTHEAMQYYHVDAEWIRAKFGIEVTTERSEASTTAAQLAADRFFG